MMPYGGGLCRGREWVVQYRWRDKLEASFGVTLTLTLTVLQAMLLFFQFLKGSMLRIISGPITACFPWLELSPNNPSLTPKHPSVLVLSGCLFSYPVLNTLCYIRMAYAVCCSLYSTHHTRYTIYHIL